MFAIHQRSRRRLCQAGFCLFCLLPTTGLLAWTANLKTVAHARRCQSELNQLLGLECRFQSVNYPQPGESLYESFELVAPETGQCVLHCRSLAIVRMGRKLVLEPSEIEVSADGSQKLAALLIRRLTKELPSEKAIWLIPTSVTLRSGSSEQTYDEVEARLESDADKSSMIVRFRLPEAQAGEPPMLSVVRTTDGQKQKTGKQKTIVKLDTMSAVLPISIFSAWLDLKPLVGDAATFGGSLSMEVADGHWSGELAGLLGEVDLAQLVASRFPHHLNGRANVQIEGAIIKNGKLTEVNGQVLSEKGTIGGSLLSAAVEYLGCPPRASRPDHPPFIDSMHYRYRDMSIEFEVDDNGLLLSANPDAPGGAIMLDEQLDKLLAAPTTGPAPLIQLVKLLVPSSEVQVPATKETAALVPWLPFPPIVPPAGDIQSPRSMPLHVQ